MVTPAWPEELEQLSGISWDDIEPCYEKLQGSLKCEEKENLPAAKNLHGKQIFPLTSHNHENFNVVKMTFADTRWKKVLGERNTEDSHLGKRTDRSSGYFSGSQKTNYTITTTNYKKPDAYAAKRESYFADAFNASNARKPLNNDYHKMKLFEF